MPTSEFRMPKIVAWDLGKADSSYCLHLWLSKRQPLRPERQPPWQGGRAVQML
jgi:hypothetical protein